jgi:putative component of membrane protein insertase Oxa1/YidC/SpoIIIJ protein YidD
VNAGRALDAVRGLPRALLLAAIRAYKRLVSPHKGFACAYRVHTGAASCSTLGYRAVARYGVFRGLGVLGLRLEQCRLKHERHGGRRLLARRSQAGFVDCACDASLCDGSICDLCGGALDCLDLAACIGDSDCADAAWYRRGAGRGCGGSRRDGMPAPRERRRRRGMPSGPLDAKRRPGDAGAGSGDRRDGQA